MFKRFLPALLIAVILTGMIGTSAFAAPATKAGQCSLDGKYHESNGKGQVKNFFAVEITDTSVNPDTVCAGLIKAALALSAAIPGSGVTIIEGKLMVVPLPLNKKGHFTSQGQFLVPSVDPNTGQITGTVDVSGSGSTSSTSGSGTIKTSNGNGQGPANSSTNPACVKKNPNAAIPAWCLTQSTTP